MIDPIKQKRNVKALLAQNGIRQVDIARRLNITRCTVSAVINGQRNSARVRRAIARALGMRTVDLWPHERGKVA